MPTAAEDCSPRFRVLITAGPTHEPIDRVRYIGNRSSGRLGIALAEASAATGHDTTLLLGPVLQPLANSTQFHVRRFLTTAELQSLLWEHGPKCDVLIMAAAVADYRPAQNPGQAPASAPPSHKLARSEGGLTLQLEATPDLLAEVAASRQPHQTLIGFALEPQAQLLESARAKLRRKRIDAIVANPLETMDAQNIAAQLLMADDSVLDPGSTMSKPQFAAWLIEQLPNIIASKTLTAE